MLAETIITVLLGFPILVLSILSQAELWQRKEYRWDRMQSYLAGLSGHQYLRSWLLPAALLADIGWLLYLSQQELWAIYLGLAALICFASYHGMRVRRQGIFRPVFTSKAWLIVAGVAFISLFFIRSMFALGEQLALQMATLIMLLPLLAVPVVVGIVNMATMARKRQIIAQASACRRAADGLVVIGITGSYGKTSTKHYLQQLLPNASATPIHVNSEIGVAQDLLRQLPREKYIVEMGAYRRGEIAALAKMTRPNIGVITAIGNQHLDLFGSQENILQAKWELIEGLSVDGVAVLNAEDPLLVKKAKDYSGKIIWYGTNPLPIQREGAAERQHLSLSKERSVANGDRARCSEVVVHPRHITCTIHIGSASQVVTIPLASRGLLGSVLAAVAAAFALGEQPEDLFQRVQSLEPFARTMEIRAGRGGAIIIDDSYSANEVGVINAIEHLKLFEQSDKRIVMVPLIELGKEAAEAQRRIDQALFTSGAKVFMYGKGYHMDAKALATSVSQGLSDQSVVLLEGRIPEIVRRAVL